MSDLRKAFAGITEARAPEHSSTQALKHFISSGQRAQAAVDELTGPRLAPPPPGTAKSRNPEYAAVKVFVRKRTHKAASRKWEDQGAGGDFSDLVEQLLQMYLETKF